MRRLSSATRIADQVGWSAAFFLFNSAALASLNTAGFAALAVATAVAFIAIAMNRSFALTSGVVAGASVGVTSTESVSIRRVYASTAVFSLATGAVMYVWLSLSGSAIGQAVELAALAAVMVASDSPRQILIVSGRYIQSLGLSIGYAVGGLLGFALSQLWENVSGVLWIAVLLVIAALGAMLVAVGQRNRARSHRAAHVGNLGAALALEAAYYGLAGQLGLILLFALSSDAATASLRISYALVFAPAFSLLQGLMPILVRKLSESRVGENVRQLRRLLVQWALLTTSGAGVSALLSLIWLPYFAAVNVSDLLPFLIPVGVSLVSSQILEAVVLGKRIDSGTKGLHLQRSILAGADMASQAAGVIFLGVPGLVAAISLISVVKLGLAMFYFSSIGRGSEPRDVSTAGIGT
ncbi:hypothetical protein ACFJGV_06290 [Cnuibacter sp. UC19_7]|uniref:hypothetical protein n=1 Tax=Cnuibacter sp. UC19_7 TaxID=3350166 RepID=UPI00366CF106